MVLGITVSISVAIGTRGRRVWGRERRGSGGVEGRRRQRVRLRLRGVLQVRIRSGAGTAIRVNVVPASLALWNAFSWTYKPILVS